MTEQNLTCHEDKPDDKQVKQFISSVKSKHKKDQDANMPPSRCCALISALLRGINSKTKTLIISVNYVFFSYKFYSPLFLLMHSNLVSHLVSGTDQLLVVCQKAKKCPLAHGTTVKALNWNQSWQKSHAVLLSTNIQL